MQCALRAIDKSAVIERLPPSVRDSHERFTTCDACHRVFWEGSHWRRMQALLDESLRAAASAQPVSQ